MTAKTFGVFSTSGGTFFALTSGENLFMIINFLVSATQHWRKLGKIPAHCDDFLEGLEIVFASSCTTKSLIKNADRH